MKRSLAAILFVAFSTSALAQMSPVGVWKTIDDETKKEKSLVRIKETNGVFTGTIEKFLDPATKLDEVCDKCSDDRKGKPVLGEQITKFTTEIGFKGFQNPDEVGAAAVDYLRVAGHLVFGYMFARMAQVALRQIAAGSTDPFYTAKLQTARFYFAKLFPETATLMRTARAGSKVLMDTEAALA